MAGVSNRLSAGVFVFLLLFSTSSSLLTPQGAGENEASTFNPDWVRFEVSDDVYRDAIGVMDERLTGESRDPLAITPLGTFDMTGLILERPVPESFLEPRFDVLMLIVSNDMRFHDVRLELEQVPGLAVREFISPSGLMVQGTPEALQEAELHDAVLISHAVPIGMFLHADLMDLVLLNEGESAMGDLLLRLDGWRDAAGPLDAVSLTDRSGFTLEQDLGEVARQTFVDSKAWDVGRYEGKLASEDLPSLLLQPSVMQLRPDPAFAAFNDQSRGHMKASTMTTYFTTDLDGSGQIVAVADSGLDEDHGDFGTRVVGNYDVIGDGSTADKHSGHGTHVACTVWATVSAVDMEELPKRLTSTSKPWKTTTQEISNHHPSIICSTPPTMPVLEPTPTHGALRPPVNNQNTILRQRTLTIEQITTTGITTGAKA
jgi:hypothetical protein